VSAEIANEIKSLQRRQGKILNRPAINESGNGECWTTQKDPAFSPRRIDNRIRQKAMNHNATQKPIIDNC
jgi:hypothetical protein